MAAALRVCERYAPQVQGLLFNYTSAAKEDSSEYSAMELAQPCACLQALRDCSVVDNCLHEGHVCTTDLTMLKWSYLQGLADKGRKFRLELPLEATRDDLKRAIDNYITWYCQRKGIHHKAKLEAWAAAIMRQAQLNLEKGLQQSRFSPLVVILDFGSR